MRLSIKPVEDQKSAPVGKQNLILDSLNVSGFRCFRHLKINRLERINLFLGKNSAGKTALLESIDIFGNNGIQDTLIDILLKRGEIESVPKLQNEKGAYQSYGFENLFRNRPVPIEASRPRKHQVSAIVSSAGDPLKKVAIGFLQKEAGTPFTVVIHGHTLKKFPVHFARLDGIGEKKIQHLWNSIELSPFEDFINDTLRILVDDLLSVRLLEHKEWNETKVPFARLESHNKPVQLQSLGFGANRLFEIFLLAVNSRNGFLLIDEIDSGIHYTALDSIWEALFEISRRLDIQVFVTGSGKNLDQSFLNSGDSSVSRAVFHLEKTNNEVSVAKIEKRLATEGSVKKSRK